MALLFFMNPYLAPCDPTAVELGADGTCVATRRGADDDYVDARGVSLGACRSWAETARALTPLRAWVAAARPVFPREARVDGEDAGQVRLASRDDVPLYRSPLCTTTSHRRAAQTCWAAPDGAQLAAYWVFVLVEIVAAISLLVALSLRRRGVRRGARLLSEHVPPFPKRDWPTVDVLICHYSEVPRRCGGHTHTLSRHGSGVGSSIGVGASSVGLRVRRRHVYGRRGEAAAASRS